MALSSAEEMLYSSLAVSLMLFVHAAASRSEAGQEHQRKASQSNTGLGFVVSKGANDAGYGVGLPNGRRLGQSRR